MLAYLLEQLSAVWTAYHDDGPSEESSDSSPPLFNDTKIERMNTGNPDDDCRSGSAQHGTDNPKESVSAEDPEEAATIPAETNGTHPASDTETGTMHIEEAFTIGQSIKTADGEAVTAARDDLATAVSDSVVTASGIPAVASDVDTTASDARDATSGRSVTAAPAAATSTPPTPATAIATPNRFAALAFDPTTGRRSPTLRTVLPQRASSKEDRSVSDPSAQRASVPGSLEWLKARAQEVGASGKVEQSTNSTRVSRVQQNFAVKSAGSRQLTQSHGKAPAEKPDDKPRPATAVYRPGAVEIVKPLLGVKPWICAPSGDEQFPELLTSILPSMTREKRLQQNSTYVLGGGVVSEMPEANCTIPPVPDGEPAAVDVPSQEPFSTATETPTDVVEVQGEPTVKIPQPIAGTGQVDHADTVEQFPATSKSAKRLSRGIF